MTKTTIYKPEVPRQISCQAIRGINYVVNTWGNADDPLLVYLHGWGDTGSTFQFVVDEFRQRWFVLAPDWRGFGRSSDATGAARTAYWFADYLADLDQLLMHYSPSKPVCLIGHSMGGNVAGLYAGAMPERVKAFVNIEGFGLPDSDPATAPDRYRQWIEKSYHLPEYSDIPDFSSLANRIRRRSPQMTKAQAEFVAREWAVADEQGGVHLRADPRHRLPSAVLYRRGEAEACWRRASADVLLVGGSESPFLVPDATGGASSVPDLPFPRSRRHLIEDAGHMLHFEQPAALARAIEGFFSKSL